MDKQQAALVALFGAIGNTLVAFGAANAVLAAGVQSVGYGLASVILYYLHRKDVAGV